MFSIFDKLKNSQDRKQLQFLLKILVFVVIFGLVIFAVKTTDNRPKQANIGQFSITKEDKTLKSKWIGEAANDLKSQQDTIKNLERRIVDVQNQNKSLEDKLKKIESDKGTQQPSNSNENNNDDGLYKKFPKPNGDTSNLDKYVPQGLKNIESLVSNKNDNGKKQSNPENILAKHTVVENQVFQNSLSIEAVPPKKSDDNKSDEKPIMDILPSGAIIKARLTNGMDAPTMSQAKDNPLITHMIVTDLAILPNKFKYDVKECFILGEGYGDLASERVYIRTNTLSCVTENGEHIDYDLKGYVAGEDGKIGLRGEVVSKQGAILARAILAGFVDGVGKAFSQVGNTVQITPYGTTTSSSDISTQELAKKGMYSGLSSGASKLADFYLKLADQVYPVIEISADREVDVVVSKRNPMDTLEDANRKQK